MVYAASFSPARFNCSQRRFDGFDGTRFH